MQQTRRDFVITSAGLTAGAMLGGVVSGATTCSGNSKFGIDKRILQQLKENIPFRLTELVALGPPIRDRIPNLILKDILLFESPPFEDRPHNDRVHIIARVNSSDPAVLRYCYDYKQRYILPTLNNVVETKGGVLRENLGLPRFDFGMRMFPRLGYGGQLSESLQPPNSGSQAFNLAASDVRMLHDLQLRALGDQISQSRQYAEIFSQFISPYRVASDWIRVATDKREITEYRKQFFPQVSSLADECFDPIEEMNKSEQLPTSVAPMVVVLRNAFVYELRCETHKSRPSSWKDITRLNDIRIVGERIS